RLRGLARLWRVLWVYVAGARPARTTWRNDRLNFAKASRCSGIAKTHSCHIQRRTAVMASEKVVVVLPGHWMPAVRVWRAGIRTYSRVTKLYSPNRQGATRKTVLAHQPRVVSNPT